MHKWKNREHVKQRNNFLKTRQKWLYRPPNYYPKLPCNSKSSLIQRMLAGKCLMELLFFLLWRFLEQEGFIGGHRETSLPLKRVWWDNLVKSKALGLTKELSYCFRPVFQKICKKEAFSVPYNIKNVRYESCESTHYKIWNTNSSFDARELRNAYTLASDQLLNRCFQRRGNMLQWLRN